MCHISSDGLTARKRIYTAGRHGLNIIPSRETSGPGPSSRVGILSSSLLQIIIILAFLAFVNIPGLRSQSPLPPVVLIA